MKAVIALLLSTSSLSSGQVSFAVDENGDPIPMRSNILETDIPPQPKKKWGNVEHVPTINMLSPDDEAKSERAANDQRTGDAKERRLIEWLKGPSGIKGLEKLEITTVGNPPHRGTVALEDIGENEIFIQVPPKAILSSNVELKGTDEEDALMPIWDEQSEKPGSRPGALLTKTDNPFVYSSGEPNKHRRLTLRLLYELKKGKESFWAPYIDVLPKTFSRPQDWSQEDRDLLVGSPAIADAEYIMKYMKREYDGIFPLPGSDVPSELQSITYEEWLWAKGIVNTRCFLFKVEGVEDIGLVALADLPNHHNVDVKWKCDQDGTFNMLTMKQTFQKGEEVFIKYGNLDNLHLLMSYGFMLPNNEVSIPKRCTDSKLSKPEHARCIMKALESYNTTTEDDIDFVTSPAIDSVSFNTANAWRLRLEEKQSLLDLTVVNDLLRGTKSNF